MWTSKRKPKSLGSGIRMMATGVNNFNNPEKRKFAENAISLSQFLKDNPTKEKIRVVTIDQLLSIDFSK